MAQRLMPFVRDLIQTVVIGETFGAPAGILAVL